MPTNRLMYWLNIEWADETESTYEQAAANLIATLPRAMDAARDAHRETGCPVYVIESGTVVGWVSAGKEMDHSLGEDLTTGEAD